MLYVLRPKLINPVRIYNASSPAGNIGLRVCILQCLIAYGEEFLTADCRLPTPLLPTVSPVIWLLLLQLADRPSIA